MNVAFCGGCRHRQYPCAGPCPCKIDGVDSVAHAKANYCPHPDGPRFGTATQPADWNDPKYRPPLPVASEEELQALFEKDRQQGPCCGG